MEGRSVLRKDGTPALADAMRRGCRRCSVCGEEFDQDRGRPRRTCYRGECIMSMQRERNRAKDRRRAHELWGRALAPGTCARCYYLEWQCRCTNGGR